MKFITVSKSPVNQKAPAENILGIKVYFISVLFRAEMSLAAAALPECLTALTPGPSNAGEWNLNN